MYSIKILDDTVRIYMIEIKFLFLLKIIFEYCKNLIEIPI